MKTNLKERIEFNPQKDMMGKTIERNRASFKHLAVPKGL